jgi:Uma2 family endonuclease
VAIQQKFYSVTDLWELIHDPRYSEKRLELSEGMLIEMSPAGGKHGVIAGMFLGQVYIFVKQHQLGYVTAAETGYILFQDDTGKDTVRGPDVGFIRADRLPEGVPDGFIPVPPDLAVEVVSPNDRAGEIQKKVQDYLKARVPLFCDRLSSESGYGYRLG